MVYIFGLAVVFLCVVVFWVVRALINKVRNWHRRRQPSLPPPVTQPTLSETAEHVFARFMSSTMAEDVFDPVPPPPARRRSSVYSGVVRAHPECDSDPDLPHYCTSPYPQADNSVEPHGEPPGTHHHRGRRLAAAADAAHRHACGRRAGIHDAARDAVAHHVRRPARTGHDLRRARHPLRAVCGPSYPTRPSGCTARRVCAWHRAARGYARAPACRAPETQPAPRKARDGVCIYRGNLEL
ncbi:hypothetical protein CC85DRAFT_284052 [Cutaneotrichosporon oleaginosum]|uniref:Uncharacterized protein n=1 Tax=Cutaneotrichosporon oleaginosum TaxID=879819 RepID=A0A0J0XSH2_9TREE|nr:uncharacterized protein CC85DRAFT_284052 [Cutaneotrichosporon oleaginosum]KLT44017.1 hypothetical protein CC85DRAFT_284052 [Cutaneotrichosporon oleaginosum]TXT04036.1 hypothetical protein COLE_07733 [Cutaneotrichosporon oleaginosum]